jgi:transcriptional regulator with GAF, ATPase, and Fis domain
MTERLLVTVGPSKGVSLNLEGDEIVIGRDASCQLCLPDATLSRRHAGISFSASGWIVRDMGSLNGIQVNGVAVSEKLLVDGDRLELGASTLLFRSGVSDEVVADVPGEPTLRLQAPHALYAGTVTSPGEGRAPRDLAALLAATRRFAEARTEERLAEILLSTSLQAVQASAGVVLVAEDGNDLRPVMSLSKEGSHPPVAFSRTAVAMALSQREALVWNPSSLVPTPISESLRSVRAGAVAAIPILGGDMAGGVLYLIKEDPGAHFSELDTQLLFGLCSSAATAFSVVRHVSWLEGERRRLATLVTEGDEFLGDSPPMKRIRDLVTRAAASDSTVLLLGESGTGKELAAHAVHARSGRRRGPFVAVNAAALVETLVESELFGHEKGAFTGAVTRHKGKLEMAHGGTLFLDEIGEMPLSLQSKLLRVLETREFERVGGTVPVKVDVRLVAATNRDLKAEVEVGRFRRDLYYRLSVVSIALPPLRDRREDIPLLASFFLARHAAKLGRRFDGFSPAALSRLVSYAWPGNVRELSNAVERAAVLSDGGLIRPEDLPETLLESGASSEAGEIGPYHEAVNHAKRMAVSGAMAETKGNVTDAARRLGLHPNYLHRLLNQLGLRSS